MISVNATTARAVPVPETDGLFTVEVRGLDGLTWEYSRWDLSFAQADWLAAQVRIAGWISDHHWTREVLCLAFSTANLLTLEEDL